ncbi:MAG: hypothetical protein IJR85_08985 [Synergistaceae bacterium]|nr:hypothetical protein [Synergistaceae bacterium]
MMDMLRGIAGFRKLLVLAAGAVVLLIANIWLSSDVSAMSRQNEVRHSRLNTLLTLGADYKTQQGNTAKRVPGASDVAAVFARISERMELGSRVNRIAPDGANQSVEVNRLYAEELSELYRELAQGGVRVIAAELRALPAGSERLFTLSAIIGPVN